MLHSTLCDVKMALVNLRYLHSMHGAQPDNDAVRVSILAPIPFLKFPFFLPMTGGLHY